MSNKNHLFLFLFIVGLFSCRKDIPPTASNPIITGGVGGMYIVNEGNFQFGNSSISYYESGMEEAVFDLFEPTNGRPLGDVFQSMYFFNGKAYLVINNSSKIEVVNANTFESQATISGFNSPRYFLPVSNNKAYVTDLYDDAISIVDLSSHQKIGEIPCKGWTEELVLAYGKAFVTNRSSNQLYIINTSTDAISDSIEISKGAGSILEDRNGKLWVLSSGSQSNNQKAVLCQIDPITHSIEREFQFNSIEDAPGSLTINASLDTLYYLNNGVFQMPIIDENLPLTPIIEAENKNFYGLGFNPFTHEVLVADAIDFVQRGRIYVYKPNGTPVKSFLAGIIPSDFYFNIK